MSVVINVALPVFAIILAGFLAGRARILGDTASEALNAFVYWFALPPLLFMAMARTTVSQVLNWPFIGAYLGGVLAVWALAALVGAVVHRASPAVMVMQGMNASFPNTGYMGIPLFAAAFGAAALAPALLATVIMSAVAVGLAVILLELTSQRGHGLGKALGGVAMALVRNPLVVAPALGLGWSGAALTVPVPVANLFQLLGASASPCALFAIGLFMASRPLAADLAEVGWISVLKLLWQPFVTWGLAVWLFPMDAYWTASAILLAALPTGTLTFVVAQRYGVYVERTSGVILVSTVLSVVTLSILLAIFGPQFPPA